MFLREKKRYFRVFEETYQPVSFSDDEKGREREIWMGDVQRGKELGRNRVREREGEK